MFYLANCQVKWTIQQAMQKSSQTYDHVANNYGSFEPNLTISWICADGEVVQLRERNLCGSGQSIAQSFHFFFYTYDVTTLKCRHNFVRCENSET